MKTVEEFVDEMKKSEALQDDVRGIFAEFLLSEEEGEQNKDKPVSQDHEIADKKSRG